MKLLIIFIALLLISVSCNIDSDHHTNINQIEILPLDFNKTVYSSEELIDDYFYISLETIDTVNLIGKIDKIEYFDNKIFVLDRTISKGVFIFNRDGNYMSKIDYIGNGPGEFEHPFDFAIDKDEFKIVLYCRKNQKLLNYDFEGNFLNEFKIGIGFRSFMIYNGYYLFYTKSIYNFHDHYGDLNFDYFVLDSSWNIVNKLLPNEMSLNKSVVSLYSGSYFKRNGNTIILSSLFNDTVFKVSPDLLLEPYCYFDFGINSIPKSIFKEKEDMYLYKDVVLDGLYWCKYGPIEFTNNLGLVAISAGISNDDFNGIYSLLFSKDFNSKLIFQEIVFDDDIEGFHTPISNKGEYFISVLYPEDLLDKAERMNKNEPVIIDGVDNEINAFDNPILMFIKFKKI